MKKTFKTIDQLIEEKNSFISAIPNNLGINLCSVKGIEYETKKDGQLKTLKIVFIPADETPVNPDVEEVNTSIIEDKTDIYFDQQTRMSCVNMAVDVVGNQNYTKGQKSLDECVIDVATKMYDFITNKE